MAYLFYVFFSNKFGAKPSVSEFGNVHFCLFPTTLAYLFYDVSKQKRCKTIKTPRLWKFAFLIFLPFFPDVWKICLAKMHRFGWNMPFRWAWMFQRVWKKSWRLYASWIGSGEGRGDEKNCMAQPVESHNWLREQLLCSFHGNPQPSFLGVISYNPYIGGLKTFMFHGFGVLRFPVIYWSAPGRAHIFFRLLGIPREKTFICH